MKHILRWGIYASALIPLVIWNDFLSPFHFGKGMLFRALVEVLAILYLIWLLRTGRDALPPRTGLFWAVTLFMLTFGLTTVTSSSWRQSLWGTLERMGGWFSFFHFWLFFVISTAVLKKKEQWLTYLRLLIWVSLLSAFYGFLQKTSLPWITGAGGRAKIFGTLGNPALFAGYMLVNVFLGLLLLVQAPARSFQRRVYALLVWLDSLAIFLTGIRGSVLALLLGLVYFGWRYAGIRNQRWLRRAALASAGLVIVLAGLLYVFKDSVLVKSNHYLARYADISLTSYTVKTRWWAWQAGLRGMRDSVRHLVVGYGPENFNIPFAKYFNPKFYEGPGSETLFDRAHNQFVEVAVTMGLLGLLAYLAILYAAWRGLRRLEPVWRAGLTAGLLAYVIHNFFIFDTTANYLMFFSLLGLINFFAQPATAASPVRPQRTRPLWVGLAAGGASLAVLVSLFYTVIVPVRANYTTTRGVVASWADDHATALRQFKQAISYDTFGTYDIRQRFAQYLLEYYGNRPLGMDGEAEINLASTAMRQTIAQFPHDYLPYLYISRADIILGRNDPRSPYNDQALANANQALAISPTYIRTYYELAQAYLNKKDYPHALATFRQAVKLNPMVPISSWYLGLTELEAGQTEAGRQDVAQAIQLGYPYTQSETDLLRLAKLYLATKESAKLLDVYQNLIVVKPRNPQYHASLAAAYAQAGQIDAAVAEARQAAALDPKDFEHDAILFVRSLGRQW